jgi:hypothetical protein
MHKERIQLLLDEMPDEVDVELFIEELLLLRKIELGEEDIAQGNVLTQAEAMQRLAKWLP